ncbi:ABC transporter ATP-binding protein [Halodesulfovibrio marinisediminis]|uniref:Phospholipid/cholesterol/gamma-HCH transport system ATP-binding protein n=1 Tax=Halodesulfovibrio marinisediminis DSM 17456 TaxID=1121457 RepID=A0A1N6DL39_9BACT|nr:ATP-binding cassette domain-containing protein [Halodesulfovibrio marinisediminis]SIN71393.1 phospholipid/cholesterol/gamma-HCH transport system ATP-binding protein [Halodesulfovibrio marinisediminis DSM 17456]
MSDVILSLRNVKTQYGTKVIHEGLDLDVYRGEIIGVIGGSGSGKSVLLRTILGLKHHSQGSIKIFGQQYHKLNTEEKHKIEQRWGVLFQDGALYSSLTVLENVEAALKEYTKISKKTRKEIALLKIFMAGLPIDSANLMPSELSGGMRKRASLARALAMDPEILFLDEPTAGLDPITAGAFDNLLKKLQHALGFTVFLVTHDLDTLNAICDRVAVLAEKHIYAIGTVKELSENPYPWIQDYFNGPRGRSAKTMPCGEK